MLAHQMYRGKGSVIQTGAAKKRVTPVKTRESSSSLRLPSTRPLDGHPEVKFKRGVSAETIYSLSEQEYEDQERMKIQLVKFLPNLKSNLEEIDWDLVTDKRGVSSYTTAELTSLAKERGLSIPSKALKGDLVDLLWTYKEKTEKKEREKRRAAARAQALVAERERTVREPVPIEEGEETEA